MNLKLIRECANKSYTNLDELATDMGSIFGGTNEFDAKLAYMLLYISRTSNVGDFVFHKPIDSLSVGNFKEDAIHILWGSIFREGEKEELIPHFPSLDDHTTTRPTEILRALRYFAQFHVKGDREELYSHLVRLICCLNRCHDKSIFAGKDIGYAFREYHFNDLVNDSQSDLYDYTKFLFDDDISWKERRQLLEDHEHRELFTRYLWQDSRFKCDLESAIRNLCKLRLETQFEGSWGAQNTLKGRTGYSTMDAETQPVHKVLEFLIGTDRGFRGNCDFEMLDELIELERDKDVDYRKWVNRCKQDKRQRYVRWLDGAASKARIYSDHRTHLKMGDIIALCVSTESSFVPYNLLNNYQCGQCTAGPDGENKKASILYELDPHIGTLWLLPLWDMSKKKITADDHRYKMGSAIVVQCTDETDDLVWLVDGVDAGILSDYCDCWREVFYDGIIASVKDLAIDDERRPSRVYFNTFVTNKRNKQFNEYVEKFGDPAEYYLKKVGGVESLVAAGIDPAEHYLEAFMYQTSTVWHSKCEGIVSAVMIDLSGYTIG